MAAIERRPVVAAVDVGRKDEVLYVGIERLAGDGAYVRDGVQIAVLVDEFLTALDADGALGGIVAVGGDAVVAVGFC